MAMERKPKMGKARSIHFTLHGGRKVGADTRRAGQLTADEEPLYAQWGVSA